MSGRSARRLLGAAVAVGAGVRAALLAEKPFWRDEAWVVLLLEEPLAAVAGGRPVPLGFLWATWPATRLPLPPEVALRWLPLAAGLALVPLLARLAHALGAERATVVAVAWLTAGVPPLVYYARELRPYGLDALLAVVAPLCALATLAGSGRAAAAFAACVVLAPWLTFGGVFPIGAVLGWAWVTRWRRADARTRRALALATALFALSVLGAWALAWRAQIAAPGLRRFWAAHLLGASGLPPLDAVRVAAWRYVTAAVGYHFAPPAAAPALALAALGAATWPRPGRGLLLWLGVGGAALAVAAALADRYLVSTGRLLLFAAPPLLLWVAQGLATLGRWTRTGALFVAVAAAAALWWSAEAVAHRLRAPAGAPPSHFRHDVLQDVDRLVGRAAALVPPGEPVLVSRYAAYAFQVYARGRLPQATYCAIYCADPRPVVAGWLARVTRRGWVLLTDEEVGHLRPALAAAGLAVTTRAAARGVALWEVHRVGA
jgi:hypothetical protein